MEPPTIDECLAIVYPNNQGANVQVFTMIARKKNVKESVLESELIRRVEALGGVAEKVTVLGRRGFFDRLIILPCGQVWFVEVKRNAAAYVSPHQHARHKKYRALQANVAIVCSLEDIDQLLAAAAP